MRNASALTVKIGGKLSLRVPKNRTARYKSYAGKELIFGLRPEHMTVPRTKARTSAVKFNAKIEVVEPMGNETMVYYVLNGTEMCARIDPAANAVAGKSMQLEADMNHMHLIDPKTNLVI